MLKIDNIKIWAKTKATLKHTAFHHDFISWKSETQPWPPTFKVCVRWRTHLPPFPFFDLNSVNINVYARFLNESFHKRMSYASSTVNVNVKEKEKEKERLPK